MTTSIFNMERFLKVMKRMMFLKKHKALYTISGICICFLFLTLPVILFQIGNGATSAGLHDMFVGIEGTIIVAISAILTIPASTIMKDMRAKQQRISEFMLPGTMLEKYIVRLLFVTLGLFLMTMVALVAADLLQQLISLIVLQGAHCSLVKGLFDFLNNEGTTIWMIGTFVLLWGNSLFVIGGLIFRKNAWALAMLSIFVLFILVDVLFFGYVFILCTYTDYEVYMPQVNWEVVVPCIMSVLTLFNYWLGYIIYRRQQVINNRFFQI